jgi:hypothetical protein
MKDIILFIINNSDQKITIEKVPMLTTNEEKKHYLKNYEDNKDFNFAMVRGLEDVKDGMYMIPKETRNVTYPFDAVLPHLQSRYSAVFCQRDREGSLEILKDISELNQQAREELEDLEVGDPKAFRLSKNIDVVYNIKPYQKYFQDYDNFFGKTTKKYGLIMTIVLVVILLASLASSYLIFTEKSNLAEIQSKITSFVTIVAGGTQ